MNSLRHRLAISLLVLAVLAQARAHEEEIVIGRNSAGKIQVRTFSHAQSLPPSIFPGIFGFATGEIGIHSAMLDEPTADFFPFSGDVDIRLGLLAKTPGVEVWNDTGSAFMITNELYFVGNAPFDAHPLWNIVRGAPTGPYVLTFRAHDLTGRYADSDAFEATFKPKTAAGPFAIRVAQTNSGSVTLAWSTNSIGWELESATNVTSTNWTLLTNSPVVSGMNYWLNISSPAGQRFFRLRRPGL